MSKILLGNTSIIEKIKLTREKKYTKKAVPTYVERNKMVESVSKELNEQLYREHNHSWYQELLNRNKGNLDKVALFYRGTNITYGEMFKKMEEYSLILDELGVKKGDEIPVCIGNCPELVYIMGACSIIGAKLNLFGEDLPEDSIKKVFSDSESKLLIASDDKYSKISKNALEGTDKHIVFSLADSLPSGMDPYIELDKDFYDFKNRVADLKNEDSRVISKSEFESIKSKKSKIENKVSLDDEFIISYSTGSTGTPKAIVHTVKSLVAMGRWHDKDVSEQMSIKWMTVLDHIYSHSNTGLIGSLSDGLLQGCKVALEPIFEPEHLVSALLINKPNYVVESRSFWLTAANQLLYDERYKNVKMPFLFLPFSVGEPTSRGEEKLFNKMLRKVNAGQDILKLPTSPITMSIAGGSCEHGGIFFILFRALRYKMPYQIKKDDAHGMGSYKTVEYAVLDETGHYCDNDVVGELVANSTCNMKCYKNNKELTDDFFITDAYGKRWARCNVFASIDKKNYVHIKGRKMKINEPIMPFEISEIVEKDTKHILSSETTLVDYEGEKKYLIHIEPQYKSGDIDEIMKSIVARLIKKFGKDIKDKIVIRPVPQSGLNIQKGGKRNLGLISSIQVGDDCYFPKVVEKEISFRKCEENVKKKIILK